MLLLLSVLVTSLPRDHSSAIIWFAMVPRLSLCCLCCLLTFTPAPSLCYMAICGGTSASAAASLHVCPKLNQPKPSNETLLASVPAEGEQLVPGEPWHQQRARVSVDSFLFPLPELLAAKYCIEFASHL